MLKSTESETSIGLFLQMLPYMRLNQVLHMTMRIKRVETFVLKVEGPEAYLGQLPDSSTMPADGYTVRPPWLSLYSPRFETLLVRLEAEDGTSGWGEALAPVGPEVPAKIVELLLAPTLLGLDALKPKPAYARLRGLMRERGHLVGHQADALAAVDIALWDLAGKITNLSVATLLGGAYRTWIPSYVSGLPKPTDPERAALAEEWSRKGTQVVKLHLGYGVEADLATFDAVRQMAPRLGIAVDAHWAYNLKDAQTLARGLSDRGGSFLEAPLAPEDIDGHAAITASADLPIAVGETLRNRFEFALWLDRRSLDIAQPDLARTGITEAAAIAEVCSSKHTPVAPHHSVGLGVALAAGLQLSASLENFLVFEYQPLPTDVGAQILSTPLDVLPDGINLPQNPGLGVEVDEDAVRRLANSASRTISLAL